MKDATIINKLEANQGRYRKVNFHMHAHMFMHSHMQMWTHILTSIHARVHMHTNTYTHTLTSHHTTSRRKRKKNKSSRYLLLNNLLVEVQNVTMTDQGMHRSTFLSGFHIFSNPFFKCLLVLLKDSPLLNLRVTSPYSRHHNHRADFLEGGYTYNCCCEKTHTTC